MHVDLSAERTRKKKIEASELSDAEFRRRRGEKLAVEVGAQVDGLLQAGRALAEENAKKAARAARFEEAQQRRKRPSTTEMDIEK